MQVVFASLHAVFWEPEGSNKAKRLEVQFKMSVFSFEVGSAVHSFSELSNAAKHTSSVKFEVVLWGECLILPFLSPFGKSIIFAFSMQVKLITLFADSVNNNIALNYGIYLLPFCFLEYNLKWPMNHFSLF